MGRTTPPRSSTRMIGVDRSRRSHGFALVCGKGHRGAAKSAPWPNDITVTFDERPAFTPTRPVASGGCLSALRRLPSGQAAAIFD